MIKSSPLDYFLYAFSFISLYYLVADLNNLTLVVGNLLAGFSKVSGLTEQDNSNLHLAVPMVVVALAIFLVSNWLLGRELKKDPAKNDLTLRKSYLYLSLFVIGGGLIVSIVSLGNYLVTPGVDYSSISVRFVTYLIALIFIAYLVYSLVSKQPSRKLLAVGSLILVVYTLALVFAGIYYLSLVNGNSLDQQQIENLSRVQSNLTAYWAARKSLPNTIEDLNQGDYSVPKDLITKLDYLYTKTGDRSFTLCAQFGANSTGGFGPDYSKTGDFWNWNHGSGNYCFERYLDPTSFPTSTSSRLGE